MAKKVAIILFVIMIVGIAVVGFLIYTDSADKKDNNAQKAHPTKEAYVKDYNENTSFEHVEEATQATEESETHEVSTEVSDDTSVFLTSHVFTLMGVHDNQTGTDVQPRVVFGENFVQDECYLKFDDQGNFEIYISGFSGMSSSGTYTEKDDVISVTLTDGSIAEYDINRDYEGEIDSIVVPVSEYSVIFWY